MKKRPLSVTLISCLFIAAGSVGIIYHAEELMELGNKTETLWVLLVRILAIIGGVFTLLGSNRARWLLVVWISYHVGLSMFHSFSESVAHAALLILVAYSLFNREAIAYFRKK